MLYSEDQIRRRFGASSALGGLDVTERLLLVSRMSFSKLAPAKKRLVYSGSTASNCIVDVAVPSLTKLVWCKQSQRERIMELALRIFIQVLRDICERARILGRIGCV